MPRLIADRAAGEAAAVQIAVKNMAAVMKNAFSYLGDRKIRQQQPKFGNPGQASNRVHP
jgi:hypothetical protein